MGCCLALAPGPDFAAPGIEDESEQDGWESPFARSVNRRATTAARWCLSKQRGGLATFCRALVWDCEEGGWRETSEAEVGCAGDGDILRRADASRSRARSALEGAGGATLAGLEALAVSLFDTARDVLPSTRGHLGDLLQPQREVGFRQALCEGACRRPSGTSVGLCVPFTVLSLVPSPSPRSHRLAGESEG